MSIFFNQNPLVVNIELAEIIGLNESIFLQQLHYWIQKSSFENEGRFWVYNSIEEWKKQFKFWSDSTIKRIIRSLKSKGFLEIEKLSKDKRNKTNFYTINYIKIEEISNPNSVTQCIRSECTDPSGQIDPMDEVNVNRCINSTETTTETTTENKKVIKKEFSFTLSKKQSYDNLSDEYKKKLAAKCLLLDGNIDRYEEFVDALEAKGYQYKNFAKAYQSWDKERAYKDFKPTPEPRLGKDWVKVKAKGYLMAINTKTLEVKRGKLVVLEPQYPTQPPPTTPTNRNVMDKLKNTTKEF